MTANSSSKQTILYISHGAGPLPILGDEGHREMVDNLQALAARVRRPSAIIVVSAHWEEPVPTITGAAAPELVYDYYGFPQESYEIEYPAPGDPALAGALHDALGKAGIKSRVDGERGFDHGLFIPLKIMFPEADIPCIQLSLVEGLDPAAHLALGRALAPILEQSGHENLLILGSGFSFHNMRGFFQPDTPETAHRNRAFQEWLADTCADPGLSREERERGLLDWENAPNARYCHPREEHLLPVHVCCAAAGRPCDQVYSLAIFGKEARTFLWE